jgi:hypothetical protein
MFSYLDTFKRLSPMLNFRPRATLWGRRQEFVTAMDAPAQRDTFHLLCAAESTCRTHCQVSACSVHLSPLVGLTVRLVPALCSRVNLLDSLPG